MQPHYLRPKQGVATSIYKWTNQIDRIQCEQSATINTTCQYCNFTVIQINTMLLHRTPFKYIML